MEEDRALAPVAPLAVEATSCLPASCQLAPASALDAAHMTPSPPLAWDGLVDPGTLARMHAAHAGLATERRLRIGALEPGDVGVLEAIVRSVSPVKSFTRTRGGEGLLARVHLADATGEVELVLWDQETQRLATPLFEPGARIRLRGAQVRAGYRGGIELGLGSGVVEAVAATAEAPGEHLEGILSLGLVRVARPGGAVPAPGLAAPSAVDAVVAGRRVALSGDLALAAERLEGQTVRLGPVMPHAHLAGWCVLLPGARLHPVAAPGGLADTPK